MRGRATGGSCLPYCCCLWRQRPWFCSLVDGDPQARHGRQHHTHARDVGIDLRPRAPVNPCQILKAGVRRRLLVAVTMGAHVDCHRPGPIP
jgi:hypothetical protein